MALFAFRHILRRFVERWELLAPIEGDVRYNGTILFQPDNTHDIGGVSGSTTRPRDLTLGRNLECAAANINDLIEMPEIADPAAPVANKARIYVRDSGGKTQLVVRFPTGAIQQIAIEP